MVQSSRKYAGFQIGDLACVQSSSTDEKVSLLPVVTGFYVLEDLYVASILTINKRGVRPPAGFWAWRGKVSTVRHYYHMMLADLLFDYLYGASFGEARHASSAAQMMIPEIKGGNSRKETCRKAQKYSPEFALPVLRELFYEGHWRSSYGGKAWGNIVDAAMLYESNPSSWAVFIDHAIDLSHNGGCAFDKGIFLELFDTSVYMTVLDTKRAGSLLDSTLDLFVPPIVKTLLDDAVSMKLVSCNKELRVCESKPFAYTGVKYGKRTLSEPIDCNLCSCGGNKDCSSCRQCSDCCECWYCNGCNESKDSDNDQCSNCEYCSNCCDCWYCDGCHETKSCDLHCCPDCSECADCCECMTCDSCGEHVESKCAHCGDCSDCTPACDKPGNSCDKCTDCCECQTCSVCAYVMPSCNCPKSLCHGCDHKRALCVECGLCRYECCVCAAQETTGNVYEDTDTLPLPGIIAEKASV